MTLFFRSLTLPLLIFIGCSLGYRSRIFKDFKQKQQEYAIHLNNGPSQGQDHNIICQAAKCEYKSNTTYTVTNPECGNYYTCQECPTALGNDICYLGLTSEDWVNVTEGHVEVIKQDKVYKNEEVKNQKQEEDYETDDYQDEDSFIEEDISKDPFESGLGTSFLHKFISSQSFGYVDHNDDKWVLQNREQCHVDQDGNLELSVRLIFQYYPTPFQMVSENPQKTQGKSYFHSDSVPSHIQLRQSCNCKWNKSNGCRKDQTKSEPSTKENSDEESSMLELGNFEPDDSDDDYGGEGGNFFTIAAKKSLNATMKKGSDLKKSIKSGLKFLYERAQVAMTSPELHIHFVLDDINIRNCRQPLSWRGDMPSSAFIFVGNQNFKLNRNILTSKFLKKSVRLNTMVKGIYELAYNSCIQVHCTKKRPYQSQYLISPLVGRPSPNFNISRRLMGYFGGTAPENGHPQYLVTTTSPNLVSSAPAQISTHTPKTLTNAPLVQPTPALAPPQATTSTQTEQTPTAPSGPVTNIPSFNTPVTNTVQSTNSTVATQPDSNNGFFTDVVKPGPKRTRFLIFVCVGLVSITIIVYFFFIRR